jgi:crossover junction endodeoxyribonuclease RuvC
VVVVGVDPGTQRCGYGVVARTGSRLRVLESGVLVPGDHDLPRRLAIILDGLEALFSRAGADAVAVGMCNFWPIFSESLVRLFACLMAATLTFCERAIFQSESPDLTV